MVEFSLNEIVYIKRYRDDKDEINEKGRITAVNGNMYHVSNMNMPFIGIVNKWFHGFQLQKIVDEETTKRQDIIQDLLEYADWEGGLDEVLLNMDGIGHIKSLNDPELTKQAEKFIEAWNKFQKRWKSFCNENYMEPYL